jgi:hypothetical protein
MNTYKTQFFARCPSNGIRITYSLTINTGSVIEVERIIEEVTSIGEGLHEDIGDRLLRKLGGQQVLKADHHGVQIETIRPHLAHWSATHQPTKEAEKAP